MSSQNDQTTPLVPASPLLMGKFAPDFDAPAVLSNGEIGTYSLQRSIKYKYAVLFFYPLDFTFVCPSELIAFNKRIKEFNDRNTEVIAVSIDSQFTHHAWQCTPLNKGGVGPLTYPVVADVTHAICRAYGVEHAELGVAYRATFIIDEAGIVRVQMINDLPIGRNVDEILRLIDALKHHKEHGEVCPAGWGKGDEGMTATTAGVASYLQKHEKDL
jgi:peroxiredoxin (alkyl hydroperoxide reductase subunit C)